MAEKNKLDALRPWIILAAATGVNLSMGLNYSWSVIQKNLITDWHWTNLQASLPYTAYAIVITLSMLFSGRLQRRLGPKESICIGASLMGAGLIGCSFFQQPLLIAITYSIAGMGGGICYSTTLPTVMKWFPPEKKGLATGVVISGSGLAPIYVSYIANGLLLHYGISNTFLYLGVGVSIMLLIMAQFLSIPPLGYVFPAISTSQGKIPSSDGKKQFCADVSWREMIQTSLFLKLWIMYLFISSAGLMIIGHITLIAKIQANWENGFYLVILIALFNTFGRLAAGYFSDRYPIMNIIKCIFLIMAVNLFFFPSYTTTLSLALGATLLAFCYGTCPALFPLATVEYFGLQNLASNYGVLFTAWGSAAFIGPIFAGRTVDLTGSYDYAYLVSAVLLVIALITAMTIKPIVSEQEIGWD